MTTEQVLLLDEAGNQIGLADKAEVHHADTPLHLAFSSYLFDDQGRTLLSRRALHKKTWPGIWTNTACGHPAPGEKMTDSVLRRLKDELGLPEITQVDLILPEFRYRAEMPNGVVENEMCPVFRGTVIGTPTPNPAEVDSTEWVPWHTFAEEVLNGTRDISPWCRLQVAELTKLGPNPMEWPVASNNNLPPAAKI